MNYYIPINIMERMVILNENYYSRGHYIPENVGLTREAR